MALQFRPPTDILALYEQQRQNSLNNLNQTLQNVGDDAQKRQVLRQRDMEMALRQREADRTAQYQERQMGLSEQKQAMDAKESFYKWGDVSGLPPEVQSGLFNPTQGPPTEQGDLPGGGNHIVDAFEQFRRVLPQGTEGAKAMKQSARALDQKRTFQEKQDVFDDTGTPIGYMTFDTRSGEKIFNPYSQSGLPEGSGFGPKVKPEVPAGSVEKSAAQTGFLDLIKDIRANYDKSLVGPVDSRVRDLKQIVDMPSVGLGASKEAADFVRPIADLRSAIVNERTGAAVGERQEWDRLLALIPDDKKSDPDFLAKLDSIETRYKQIISNRASAFGSAGYRARGTPPPSGGGSKETPEQRKARLIAEAQEL